MDQVASTGQSSQNPARLLRMNLAELSCVATGDPAVRSHVLKHELILLQRLESPLAHILLLETESDDRWRTTTDKMLLCLCPGDSTNPCSTRRDRYLRASVCDCWMIVAAAALVIDLSIHR